MAKFKKGDRVRRVSGYIGNVDPTRIGGFNIVDQDNCNVPYALNKSGYGGRSVIDERDYELATPSPIPDTVTIGGVEYVRKPEPEHVWAWGQWARVNGGYCEGLLVFVTGPTKDNGFVPVTYKDCGGKNHTDGFLPCYLTYLGTATIPE